MAFLIEETGERVRCLLNPETIEIRRTTGTRRRTWRGGPLVTEGLVDDPVLASGGGSTELDLQLLFDLAAEGADRAQGDVRRLTRPLWKMAEEQAPLVRFIWGKTWNIPAMVAAAAERLEQFDLGGAPRRSWLSLRLLRVGEGSGRLGSRSPARPGAGRRAAGRGSASSVHEPLAGDGSGSAGRRLDEVAASHYGDPSRWRLLAAANDVADPFDVPVGVPLILPEVEP
ncbi:MAG: hypothetical protein AAF604_05410 [Acidobacteriota bacterium]